MVMKMELLNPIRRGIVEMRGTVFVGNRVVTEADLMAQLVKRVKLADLCQISLFL